MSGNYGTGYTIAGMIRIVGWAGVAISLVVLCVSIFGEVANGALLAGICFFNSLLLVGAGYVMEAVFDGASSTRKIVRLMEEESKRSTPPLNAISENSRPQKDVAGQGANVNDHKDLRKPAPPSENDLNYKGYRIPGLEGGTYQIHGITFHDPIHAKSFLETKLRTGEPINLDAVD